MGEGELVDARTEGEDGAVDACGRGAPDDGAAEAGRLLLGGPEEVGVGGVRARRGLAAKVKPAAIAGRPAEVAAAAAAAGRRAAGERRDGAAPRVVWPAPPRRRCGAGRRGSGWSGEVLLASGSAGDGPRAGSTDGPSACPAQCGPCCRGGGCDGRSRCGATPTRRVERGGEAGRAPSVSPLRSRFIRCGSVIESSAATIAAVLALGRPAGAGSAGAGRRGDDSPRSAPAAADDGCASGRWGPAGRSSLSCSGSVLGSGAGSGEPAPSASSSRSPAASCCGLLARAIWGGSARAPGGLASAKASRANVAMSRICAAAGEEARSEAPAIEPALLAADGAAVVWTGDEVCGAAGGLAAGAT